MPPEAASADTTPDAAVDFLDELSWRGLLHQCTDAAPGHERLRRHLAAATPGSPRRIYCGFDPTADSLTIGNLVAIMALAHARRAGHQPVVVLGGATGLIGDPSGKSAERRLLTPERVEQNVASIRGIFDRVLGAAPDVGPDTRPLIVNNHDWFGALGFIDVLRDVGKHFSVNQMTQKDSVRTRLEDREQGISYTEFSYQILQAYDFLHLSRQLGVTMQLGGSDQWGNITAGTDLIRRVHASAAADERAGDDHFGLTLPLVTKADGTKFGKTESGAVWLTAPADGDDDATRERRTSPYACFQFWLNAADEDVERYLKIFTFKGADEIVALLDRHAEAPGKREAQRELARSATAILHGAAAAERAEAAGQALFSGDIATLDAATLAEVFAAVPTSDHARTDLAGGTALVDLLIETGLASSKREAREFVQNGSVSVNGRRIEAPAEGPDAARLAEADLLHGSLAAIRRGKKQWRLTRWS